MEQTENIGYKSVCLNEAIGKIVDFNDSIPIYAFRRLMFEAQRCTKTAGSDEAVACAVYIEDDISKSAVEISYSYHSISVNNMIYNSSVDPNDCIDESAWNLITIAAGAGEMLSAKYLVATYEHHEFFRDKNFNLACVGISLPVLFMRKYIPSEFEFDKDLDMHSTVGVVKSSDGLPMDYRREYFVNMITEEKQNGLGFSFSYQEPKQKSIELYSRIACALEYTARQNKTN